MDIFRARCHTKWARTFKQKHTWSVDHFGSDDTVLQCEPKSSTPFTAIGHDISLHLTYEVKDREEPLETSTVSSSAAVLAPVADGGENIKEKKKKTEKYFEVELHGKLGATVNGYVVLFGKLKLIKAGSEAVEDFGGK